MAISVHDAYTMRQAVLYEDEKGQRLMILWQQRTTGYRVFRHKSRLWRVFADVKARLPDYFAA
jgi:hypothetical protein